MKKITEHRKQRDDEPHRLLRADDLGQVQRAHAEQHGDDHEAHRDFVGDHLRRRAQRAEEGVFRVRRPARDDDAIDAERADREQVEDADIDVGDRPAVIHRDHGPGDHRQHEGQHRRQQEQDAVRARGMIVSFISILIASAKGWNRPKRPDHVRPLAQLHRRQNLALGVGEVGHAHQQRHQQRQRLHHGQDQDADRVGKKKSIALLRRQRRLRP
jgi:hypothetical protein